MAADRTDILKTVDNPDRDRDFTISHSTEEVTFLYSLTKQPCFATIDIDYSPAETCIEMMSLKEYLRMYRKEAYYFEAVTNRLLDDLVSVSAPKEMTVTARFTVRGGISTVVKARATSD